MEIECIDCGKVVNRSIPAKRCFPCADKKERESIASWQRKHPLAVKARSAVACAIKKGDLRPAKECKCVDCGRQAEVYDHRNYYKPLAVVPVCKRCNRQRGAATPYKREALKQKRRMVLNRIEQRTKEMAQQIINKWQRGA